MNHQYLGVNRAIAALQSPLSQHWERGSGGEGRSPSRRLGVFWHTQGSGKSISMLFFAQKLLRCIPGNWTFLLVTDRQELDDQIYKLFASAGVLAEERTPAESAAHLRRLLAEDHRYVVTLIQKFRAERFQTHPKLSDRADIIVITDEAHRTRYDIFARSMRDALPSASFIGFTGTPLLVGEEKTREVFGDYVSIDNFQQSREDGATVPLYYEHRIPELQRANPDLNTDMERLLDEAALDEAQESRLEREFAREYHLITRDERLDTIAADIVDHHTGRARADKAMVVSIDKATALKMHDRVRHHWRAKLELLREQLASALGPERARLQALIARMEETDMAVVVSQSQNEIEQMQKQGLDILPHRQRMVREDLETRFKDARDPFRIVFVCAMWMTGFDVPSCSTIYLDKPMRNHTLMQTIARANRVFPPLSGEHRFSYPPAAMPARRTRMHDRACSDTPDPVPSTPAPPSRRGGRRPGAGAPKGNLNAFKHGRRSRFKDLLRHDTDAVALAGRLLARERRTAERHAATLLRVAILARHRRAFADAVATGAPLPVPPLYDLDDLDLQPLVRLLEHQAARADAERARRDGLLTPASPGVTRARALADTLDTFVRSTAAELDRALQALPAPAALAGTLTAPDDQANNQRSAHPPESVAPPRPPGAGSRAD